MTISVQPVQGHAQAYIPMLDGYSEWHVTNCYFGCNTDKYYTIGDTVINLKHYTFLDKFHYNKNFLIREDTSSRKVYMRLLADTGAPKEYLLYDFSAQVNDTVSIQNPGSPYPKYAGSFVVDSVILKPLLTKSHRHFYLHSLDTITSVTKNTIWVEGIGSLCLINTPGASPQINEVGRLSCFFHNGINTYAQLDSITDCIPVYPLGVEDIFTPRYFKVSQDFNSQQVFIKALQENSGLKIYIYNTAGQLQFFAEDKRKEIVIPTGRFSGGLLLLKLETDKGYINTYKLFNP
jgi:hypothetical protein